MPLALDLATAPPPHVIAPPSAAAVWRPVVVRPGDTVWQLALDHGTTPTAIAAKNGLDHGGAWIKPGQRILVPVSGPAAARASTPASIAPAKLAKAAAPRGSVHVVRAGETLSDIAARHGIGLTKLLAANRLANPSVIHVGQRITIPAAQSTKSVAAGTSSAPQPNSSNTFAGYTYSDKTVAAAAANRRKLAGTAVPNRTQTAAIIRETALRHGVDPRLALAIAWQESGWNQRAVSVANAVGTMQIMPTSGEWASQLAGRRIDVLDTRDNITAGVLILRALQSAASSREEAVAGYYQGLHSVRTRGMYTDTKRYVSAVLAHRARM